MATAPGEVPARDACVMASAAATRHVSAAEELAAAGVATPDVAAATPGVAAAIAATPDVAAAMPATPEMAAASEMTTAASGMAVRKRDDRRAGYGHPEQQGCPDPNPSRVRRIHSSSPRRAAAISRTPALELDAPRALVFKETDIKTR
ncbi:MAG: hypothetical protein E6K45_11730 [Gammaproteobacteria bacterium]|nr:MAG: hypothetical protein E6K45_11730 [Gammaproteobacteria bacterium]